MTERGKAEGEREGKVAVVGGGDGKGSSRNNGVCTPRAKDVG